MTTVTTFLRRNRTGSAAVLSAALFFALGLAATISTAQSVATVPVGAVTVSIAAGNGVSRTLTVVSFPLSEAPLATGQTAGKITGITANSISNSDAGWTAAGLSAAASPYLIQITSGNAKGAMFLVSTGTANTATTVTLDSEESSLVDLTTLGIATGASGDTYRLIPCDTLSSILGTPETTGILGGTSAATADNVQLLVGTTYRQYYFNTTTQVWTRVGPNSNSNTVPVRPDSLVIYSRLAATPVSLVFTGQVPDIARKSIVRNAGLTTLSSWWPVDTTLAGLNINALPGWVSSTNSNTADIVQILVGTTYRQYYHNGTSWLRVGPNSVSDSVVIATGSGVFINKRGLSTGATSLSQTVPYSL